MPGARARSASREWLGDFELLALLGRGRNCEVFLAVRKGVAGRAQHDPSDLLAIKRLRPGGRANRETLLREAALASRIKHPNVVDVHELAEAGQSCFLVMEYLAGRPLGALIKKHGALPPACVASVGADIAEGLAAAHDLRGDDGEPLGVVHLDVSPSNVHVGYDGRAVLVDFGLARSADDATARGKIGYLAPEQVRRETADARTDIFALGIVLWEAMTGKRLFRRGGRAQTLEAIATEPPPPPSSRGAPPDLDGVLARALAHRREDRYPTAAAFAEALRGLAVDEERAAIADLMAEHFAADRDVAATAIAEAVGAPDEPYAGDDEWDAAAHLEATQPHLNRRAVRIAAGVAVAIAVLTLGVMLARSAPLPDGVRHHTRAETPRRASTPPPVTGDTSARDRRTRRTPGESGERLERRRVPNVAATDRGDNGRALRYTSTEGRARPARARTTP